MITNCSSSNLLYQSCDCSLPLPLCALANVSGLSSSVLWFAILAVQVWRNYKYRTIEGVSPGWAILNFTAGANNTFFVFKVGGFPWYYYAVAVYIPLLEAAMMVQFLWYTPRTSKKLVICALCALGWSILAVAQIFFDVSNEFEWVSIALWSIEYYPQIFLNMSRQSTYGLSDLSIAIMAIAKSTDFMQYYFLVMPIHYVVMSFTSGTIAQIGTLQVLWYWGQRPIEGTDKLEVRPISGRCQLLRIAGLAFFTVELAAFAVAFIWRTGELWLIVAPVLVYAVVVGCFVWLHGWCALPLPGRRRREALAKHEIGTAKVADVYSYQ